MIFIIGGISVLVSTAIDVFVRVLDFARRGCQGLRDHGAGVRD